ILFGKLFEELFLKELDIGNGDRAAGLPGGEDVTVAKGDGDLDGLDFRLAKECVPFARVAEGRAQHSVGVLRVAGWKGEARKDGRAEQTGHVGGGIHEEWLACGLPGLERERNGNEDG